jgi:hypothetical protein
MGTLRKTKISGQSLRETPQPGHPERQPSIEVPLKLVKRSEESEE